MKYYIIAGEASGDLHAANLIRQLHLLDPEADIRAWGGDLMQQAGAHVVKHYRDLAFMGFVEVVTNLKTILRNIEFCKRDLAGFRPDTVILVDYPGFNLRIARFAFEQGYRVNYYISPQIWAWKQSRVHTIGKYVHQMLVILPFEKEFYHRFGYEVAFVGHPLLDAVNNRKYQSSAKAKPLPGKKPVIALLPGSRKQEISTMLPLMLSAAKHFHEYDIAVAGAPSVDPSFYEPMISMHNARLVIGATYDLLESASAALVTSGTATLETALFNVPEVVCYKGNLISYHIARKLIKVKYISLVNLIMDEPVVTELIQDALNEKNLVRELRRILDDDNTRATLFENYRLLREKLGGPGASERAAHLIFSGLSEKS